MKTKTFSLVALLAVSVLTLAGCNNTTNTPEEEKNEIANPASVYCEENGGTLVLEEGAWLCMFEDGSYCEEWAYQRWECKPGDIMYNTVDENEEPNAEQAWYEVNYGTSEIYSQQDIADAIAAVMDTFNNKWEVKCEMHKIWYAWDEKSQEELPNVQLRSDAPYSQALVLYSNFHSPIDPQEAMAFEPDFEYTDYNWILGRTDGGEWTVIDWGY